MEKSILLTLCKGRKLADLQRARRSATPYAMIQKGILAVKERGTKAVVTMKPT